MADLLKKALRGDRFELDTPYVSHHKHLKSIRRFLGVPVLVGGSVDHVLVFVEDVSKRKELEAQVKEYAASLEKKVS